MTGLFLKIINMSISASWLILAVLLLRFLLKKAPRWIHVLLWGIVALRLLLPFSVESALSLIPSAETFPEKIVSGPSFDVQTGIAPVDARINAYLGDHYFEGVSVPADNGSHVMTVLASVWAAGMLLLAAYTAFSYWRLRRRIATAVLYQENIYRSEQVGSPFVLGIVRPRIYLPYQLEDRELEPVIAHERAHIRRRDHWWKPLGFLLLTLHWFNPLMWLAYVLLCRDIELACDEKVIRTLGSERRADYASALISCSVSRRAIAACPLAFGEVSVKERVKSVVRYRKPAFWIVLVSVAACAVVTVCFLTDPKQDSYDIKIVVPAGNQERFVYSQEEISPTRRQIVISSGDNLGDTEVVLEPTEARQENAYDESAYLTPGMPVRMEAEQGGWFRVGVNVQNSTDEDLVVFVHIRNIEVRIADTAEDDIEQYRTAYVGDAPNVSAIAQRLPYPAGYSYSSIELQTGAEPYELMVFLQGNGDVQKSDFKDCADMAFDLIGNLGVISFHTPESADTGFSFERNDSGADSVSGGAEEPSDTDELAGSEEPAGADGPAAGKEPAGADGPAAKEGPAGTEAALSLDEAVSKAILERSASDMPNALVHAESHYTVYTEEADDKIIVYLQAYESSYNVYESSLYQERGSNIPTALTFSVDEAGNYVLEEYWLPRDGRYYMADLREKFPKEALEALDAADEEIQALAQRCHDSALAQSGHTEGLETRIAWLLDAISSSPATSSIPQDYIEAHDAEYQELLGYGQYTLRYCFTEFLRGGQTGLKGHFMRSVLDDLEPDARLDMEAATGQEYFDEWKAQARRIAEQQDEDWVEKYRPAVYLLLQMMGE